MSVYCFYIFFRRRFLHFIGHGALVKQLVDPVVQMQLYNQVDNIRTEMIVYHECCLKMFKSFKESNLYKRLYNPFIFSTGFFIFHFFKFHLFLYFSPFILGMIIYCILEVVDNNNLNFKLGHL